jgi:hypothetical protein
MIPHFNTKLPIRLEINISHFAIILICSKLENSETPDVGILLKDSGQL